MNNEYIRLQKEINAALESLFASEGHVGDPLVYQAMAYATLNGGKRLRGVLCLSLGESLGIDNQAMMPFACALEMIHASTLIHDDLPCLDNDDFRRGKPACHKKFSEDTALLAGDALYSFALEHVCASADREMFSEKQILDCVTLLLHCSGAEGVIGGQILDKKFENTRCSSEELHRLHALKTGALFSVIAQMCCVLAIPAPSVQKALAVYMKNLGLAFQIKDDLLDVEGNFETLGKAVHADTQKSTFVSLFGVAGSKQELSQCIERAKQAASDLPDNQLAVWVCDFVMNRNL